MFITSSRSALADKPYCSVGSFLWQKYKWKTNYAANIVGIRKLEAFIFLRDI